jgi:beta-phosphoglucomutase-like phosphatase (HAD superfamily)
MPGPEIVAYVNEKYGLQMDVESVLRTKRAVAREMVLGFEVLQPAAGWAAWCHARKIPMAVASGGVRPMVLASLQATGLDGIFPEDCVFSASDVPRGKPHPDLFLAAADHLGVAPADCLVIEDAPPGVQAAEAAGMRWIDVADFSETGAGR